VHADRWDGLSVGQCPVKLGDPKTWVGRCFVTVDGLLKMGVLSMMGDQMKLACL
jgi:hypothetical protein